MHNDREIIRQVAGMVATELGEGWKVDTSEKSKESWGAQLDGPDDARLFLRPDHGRVRVSGDFPRGYTNVRYETTNRPINVARDRGPAVIAREIKRRFLPAYLDDLKVIKVRIEENKRDAQSQAEACRRLIEAFPGAYQGGEDTDYIRIYRNDVHGNIRLYHDGSQISELKLSGLTLDQACKIAEILKA